MEDSVASASKTRDSSLGPDRFSQLYGTATRRRNN